MDIEFIKWMCDKAEGFRWEEYNCDDDRIFYPDGKNIYLRHISKTKEFIKVIYPLLLPKAIEGVNKSCLFSKIDIDWRHMYVVCNITDVKSRLWAFDLDFNIDQAKEAALKYIYEQEK